MKLSEMLAEKIVEGYGKNESHCQMEMKHPEALEGMHPDKMVESMCEAAIDCMNHNTPNDMSRKMIAEMAGKYLKEKYGHKHEDVMKVHDLIDSSIAASERGTP